MEPGREGGTWFGMSKKGKLGMLINILLTHPPDLTKKGRGKFDLLVPISAN